MINRMKDWLDRSEPSSQRLLHQEVQAIELQLVHRNEAILTMYNEMDQLRARRDVCKLKLRQWQGKPLKSFHVAH
ncbi:MAG: hypothetical protein R2855_05955 [Thermomicrobiales bacterium]